MKLRRRSNNSADLPRRAGVSTLRAVLGTVVAAALVLVGTAGPAAAQPPPPGSRSR